MPGGLWLNNAPSWGIINAMWVSLIKWHGDKLMCSPEDRSLCIPLRSLRMSRPPLWSCGRSSYSFSSQDLNINLPLVSFPRSAVMSGMQACVPLRWLRGGGGEEGRVCVFLLWLHPAWFTLSSAAEKTKAWVLETAQRLEVCGLFSTWSVYPCFLCNFPM